MLYVVGSHGPNATSSNKTLTNDVTTKLVALPTH